MNRYIVISSLIQLGMSIASLYFGFLTESEDCMPMSVWLRCFGVAKLLLTISIFCLSLYINRHVVQGMAIVQIVIDNLFNVGWFTVGVSIILTNSCTKTDVKLMMDIDIYLFAIWFLQPFVLAILIKQNQITEEGA